jgi:hypothetical protein
MDPYINDIIGTLLKKLKTKEPKLKVWFKIKNQTILFWSLKPKSK